MAELIPKSGYRPAYIGLSTEDKDELEGVTPGSTFEEADTGLEYVYTGEAWYLRTGQTVVGNSSQEKPSESIAEGTRFFEYDTGATYYWDGTTWLPGTATNEKDKLNDALESVTGSLESIYRELRLLRALGERDQEVDAEELVCGAELDS